MAIGCVPIDSFGVDLLSEWLTILRETLPSEWIKALPKYDQDDFSEPLSFQLFIFAPPDSI
jgi:hypothetical protein